MKQSQVNFVRSLPRVVEPEKTQGAIASRNRLYSPACTFWRMLAQLFRGGSLRSAAREDQTFPAATDSDLAETKGSSGSYSDARKRLDQSELDQLHEERVGPKRRGPLRRSCSG